MFQILDLLLLLILRNEVITRKFKAKPTIPTELAQRPVTGTNNMKKCSQRLFEKATKKFETRIYSQ
jgi:hypothetical protein